MIWMMYYGFALAFILYLKETGTEGWEWWFLVLSGLAWPVVAPLTIAADLMGANERRG